jgi:hypothetical protein
MRAVLVRSMAVIGIGAVVLAGLLYVASTVDSRSPTVAEITLTQPLPEAPDVALITTGLAVEFSEPVEMSTAAGAIAIEPSVRGSVSWSGSTMIFTPSEPLELATRYTVTIGEGIRDLAGNGMTDVPEPFAFDTTGPPDVVETVPADGAEDAAIDEPIAITFSTLMDTASVEAALRLRPAFPHELRWSGRLLEIVPDDPLAPDREYEVGIGEGASDVSGVALESPPSITFTTASAGLEASVLMPADGTDGIATTSHIAIVFDSPVDPESVSGEILTITPDVAGSLALVGPDGDEAAEPGDARVLRFAPSGPLPANTTFEVELGTAVAGLSGDLLTEPLAWSFTTGAAQETLSNQIAFLSDRAGVTNLWAMNADGTAARQVSTELTPVLDYAIAPDGSSFVVGDGRRLVLADASGADRRVLTDDAFLEFDPAYAPNGQRVAFARADAETGGGLGLWEQVVDGGDAERIELDGEASPTPASSASGEDGEPAQWLRAPRYAPDGQRLAFVDLTGSVGIVDLETDEVTLVRHEAIAPPAWLPDGAGILITGRTPGGQLVPDFDAPVEPLDPLPPSGDAAVVLLDPTTSRLDPSEFGAGSSVAAIAADGRVAYLDADGALRIADLPDDAGRTVPGLGDEGVGAVSFAPGEEALAVVIPTRADDEAGGRIERVDLDDGRRSILTNDGWRPRWLP